MSWREGFYEAVKKYVKLPEDARVFEVNFTRGSSYGGCDTCGYRGSWDDEIEIRYTAPNHKNVQVIWRDIDLESFVNSLED